VTALIFNGRCVYGARSDVAAYVEARTAIQFGVDASQIEAIGIVDADLRLIGGVVYSEFHGHDIRASIAVERRALSRSVLHQIFAYPFLQLAVRRITCLVRAGNDASARLAKKLGFTQEGIARQADATGEDLIIFGILRNECRWIEGAAA
jgi:RimJ/RimL family protein N-acetyltransferase